MSDQELKLDVIKRNFIRVGKKYSNDADNVESDVEELLEQASFIECIMSAMEEWAGVISARIDEQDEKEYDENI